MKKKKKKKKKTPVIKHNVYCCALLFLTLQLHSNPQITLMAGHEIWSAAHKMTQTYGGSTCWAMYQQPGFFFISWDGAQEEQKVLFYHVRKFNKDLRRGGTRSVTIKGRKEIFFIDKIKKKQSSRLTLHLIMCNFNRAQNILMALPSSHKQ